MCPILLDLSAPDSDDEYKVEAVNVSQFGRNVTLFSSLFNSFCSFSSASIKLFWNIITLCAVFMSINPIFYTFALPGFTVIL